jgi:tetratricopeptide (TPR) repeat protein/predicted Ser/Thr protein kinase
MRGRYRIVAELGEGGFGVVYLAEQTEPVKRKVALKVLKLALASASMRARFEAEQQALAMMDHPSLAKVFDAGTTPDGQPYFAMEFAPGEPLTAFCDKRNLPLSQRLDLLARICDAVHHAHMKGVVHRDLKPGNILVGETDQGMVPKVIDFGIAKAVSRQQADRPTDTQFGQFVGTPVYMSPEQAEGGTIDIDTRSDVYSLGVILYELLVSRTPIDSETIRRSGLAALHKTLLETEPARPSARLAGLAQAERDELTTRRATDARTLARVLHKDLDWIVMRCLEKDRARRYESTSALAADLRRFLAGEPVLAGPPGASYRVEKFVKRHRFAVAAGLALTLGLVAFGVSMTYLWNDAVRQQHRAQSTLGVLLSSLRASDVSGEQASASVTMKDYLADVERQTTEKLSDQPDIAYDLRATIGWVMTSLTDYDGAVRNLAPVVEYRRTLAARGGKPEALALASSLYDLGRALYFLRRYADAKAAYTESLELRRATLPDSDPIIGRTFLHLAATNAGLGDIDAACRDADEAIRRFRALGPSAEELLSRALYSHAGTLVKAKRHAEARALVDEFIRVTMRTHPESGGEGWRVGMGVKLLAEIEAADGRPDLAIVQLRKAIALLTPRYGASHSTITGAQYELASLLCEAATGDRLPSEEATIRDASAFGEALSMARAAADGLRVDGGFPLRLSDALSLLSHIYLARGDLVSAKASAESALQVLQDRAPHEAARVASLTQRVEQLQRRLLTAP